MSQVAEDLTLHYEEANDFVKLFLPEGGIDCVAAPNLTEPPYIDEEIFGRVAHVETAVEIIAKKFFHRGNRLLARDRFDFALVADKEPNELLRACKFLVRHISSIKTALAGDLSHLRLQFDAIENSRTTRLLIKYVTWSSRGWTSRRNTLTIKRSSRHRRFEKQKTKRAST